MVTCATRSRRCQDVRAQVDERRADLEALTLTADDVRRLQAAMRRAGLASFDRLADTRNLEDGNA